MEVVLYIAVSLDGRIAGPGDDVGWLDPYDDAHAAYEEFRASIDGAVMGRATYEFARKHEPWVYPGLPIEVLTTRPIDDPPAGVHASPGPAPAVLGSLEARGCRRVWLVGGGKTIGAFLEHDLINELRMFIMPTLLGAGPLLLPEIGAFDTRLALTRHQRFTSGVMELTYARPR